MKAVVAERYGGPEVLALAERPDPKLGPDSVLVRVAAASINPVDYKIVRGYLDPAFPTYLPLIPGWDVAGEVAAVGPAVTHVRVGQPVFGYARKDYIADGTWAELVAVPAAGSRPRPSLWTWSPRRACRSPGSRRTRPSPTSSRSAPGTPCSSTPPPAVSARSRPRSPSRSARESSGPRATATPTTCGELGGQPVRYGDGLVDRVRAVAPDGVDAVVDLVGGEALRVSPALVRDPRRIVSVVD
ncbi:MAG TPA: alcohol dehydrogenase catalytic domain-containing protein, partial [Mycobacteriales bacterium]|nr:alcohol dehydrogenase catalytic domain-containing protein [Mycobacteriales bacterium]